MNLRRPGKIWPENHRHIHMPRAVGLHLEPALPQRSQHRFSRLPVPAPHDHRRRIDLRAARQEHHIQPRAPEHPRPDPCEAIHVGAVEHLDHDAIAGVGDGKGVPRHLLTPGQGGAESVEDGAGRDERAERNQEPRCEATRLFQNR